MKSPVFIRLPIWDAAKKHSFFCYLLFLTLLMVPSAFLWVAPSWDIMSHEFDFFVGQIGDFIFLKGEGLRLAGNILQSLIFAFAGLFFWFTASRNFTAPEWETNKASKRILFVVLICSIGIPWFSADCFFYLAKGWIEQGYMKDVYLTPIKDITNYKSDVFFQNVYPGFIHATGNYGAFFQLFSRFTVWVGQGDLRTSFVFLRIFFVLALLLSSLMVFRLARRFGGDGYWAAFAFAASPLVAFNTVTSLHNDILITLLVLLAIEFACRNNPGVAGLCIGIAFGFKYFPLLLLPPFVLFFFRSSQKISFVKPAIFLIAFGGAVFISFGTYPSSLPFAVHNLTVGFESVRSSLVLFLFTAFKPFLSTEQSIMAAKRVMTFLFLGSSTWLLWPYFVGKKEMTQKVLAALCFMVYLLYILLASIQIEEWFLTWFIPLGLILGEKRVTTFCLIVATGYMPFVNFMCNQNPLLVAFSQVSSYTLLLWVAVRVLFIPLFKSARFRTQLLGAAPAKA